MEYLRISVGGQTFENVYAYGWFAGAYGVIYLITMDKDTASLYKIDAGYTKNEKKGYQSWQVMQKIRQK